MDLSIFESQMKNDIKFVFNEILSSFNYVLNISAKSRSGAEISDYLEDAFVAYLSKNPHDRIYEPASAPKGKTKNPFDIIFKYKYTDIDSNESHEELIWGDIKATKASYADSNPDLGTPTKVIKFMSEGNFYLVFILFEYEATEDNRTKFIKYPDGSYVRIMFLKDIHHSVRINPKPQFQVNINTKNEYRTRDEFIDLFEQKYKESIERNIAIQLKKKKQLEGWFKKIREAQNFDQ